MKKTISVAMLIVLLLSNASIFADSKKSFDEAFLNSKAIQKYKMQLRTDDFKVIEAKMGENSISHYYGFVKEYGLNVTFDDRLKHEIIQETSAKKADLGNDIAAAAHLLELNSKKSNYKKLHLGAFKSLLDMNLSKEKERYAKEAYHTKQKMFELGKEIKEEVALAKNEHDKAKHRLDADQLEYERLKALLDYYLESDIEVKEEDLIRTQLQELDYYLSQVENRFDILMRRKQNEMDMLEIEIYEEKFKALSPVHKEKLILLKRGVQKREAEIELYKNQISDELERAYYSLSEKMRDIDNFSRKLKNLEQRDRNMKKLYDLGKISLREYRKFQLNVLEAQNGYKVMVMDYNNAYRELMYAISVGPAISF